jgi:DtxR family transcriptional regulator, Mn-dependent transcriptional regulator
MTESLEDYLETIGILRQSEGVARVKDVAARLGVSKPSVHNALHELEDRGLVSHEPYGDILLTKSGQRKSAEILGRHVLLREFLERVVWVDAAVAEKDACRIEHVLSQETVDGIVKLMKR